jgi:hypothetical protein
MFAVVQKLPRASYVANGRFCIVRENFGITEAGEKYCKLNSKSVTSSSGPFTPCGA